MCIYIYIYRHTCLRMHAARSKLGLLWSVCYALADFCNPREVNASARRRVKGSLVLLGVHQDLHLIETAIYSSSNLVSAQNPFRGPHRMLSGFRSSGSKSAPTASMGSWGRECRDLCRGLRGAVIHGDSILHSGFRTVGSAREASHSSRRGLNKSWAYSELVLRNTKRREAE